MRVLILSPEYPPHVIGGLGKHVNELAQHLVKQDVEVHVVTPAYAGSSPQEEINGVNVHRFPSYQISPLGFLDNVLQTNLNLVEGATALINKIGNFSVIHAHDWLVGFGAKVIKHAFHLPLITTIHATEHGRNHGIHNDFQSYIHNAEWMLTYEGWRVICCSKYMADELKRVFALPGDKIRVIPNGIDWEKLKTQEDLTQFRRNYASSEEKIILSVGRLVYEKGIHVLLECFPGILAAVPNTKLVIVGKGGERTALEEKAKQLGVSDRVYFTGFMSDSDLVKLYNCANVAVFPSLYEPFGIVALEGMAAGVPVVLSNTGGLGEIIVDEKEGLKANPGDSWMLGEKIIRILKDNQLADYLAQEAYRKVQDVYNWEIIAKNTKEVYQDVVEEWEKSSWFPVGGHKIN